MIASTVLVVTLGRLSATCSAASAPTWAASCSSRPPRWAPASPATAPQLILWRILQGIGGAFLFANSSAIVTDAFPREQLGLAMGTNTMVAAVGLVLGPVLGGALVEISWHWVFWFNVPFGLLGCCGPAMILRDLAAARRRPRPGPPAAALLFVRRPHRADARDLQGRPDRLERPRRDRRPDRRRRPAAALRARRAPRPRADARPDDLRRPPVRRRHRGSVPQRPGALRAACSSSSSTTRAPRATARSRPASSSRRWRSGCWSPRRWPASWADRHGSRIARRRRHAAHRRRARLP